MPPTFLLVVLILVCAAVSPLVCIALLVATRVPAVRATSRRLLRWSALAAVACVLFDVVANLAIGERPTFPGAAAGAGAGFSLCAGSMLAVQRRRRRYAVSHDTPSSPGQ